MKVNVVLYIDNVLACESVERIEMASFFNRKGAILTAIKTHYIFPGVIEFIKLLFDMENIRVSFFNSRKENKTKAKIFVKNYLKFP